MNRILHSKTKAGKLIPAFSFFILFAGVVAQAQTISNQENSTAVVAKAQAQQQKLAFIQNKGQWPAHILYKADLPGAQALVTKDGMIAGVFDPKSLRGLSAYTMQIEERRKDRNNTPEPQKPTIKGHGWKIKFVNSNPVASQSIVKEGESTDYYNYLNDNGANATNVHSYGAITYKNVYNGIDVRYYSTADNLGMENDIIIQPGADASKVAFIPEGIPNYTLDEKGNLILHTTVSAILLPAPVTYTIDNYGNRQPVASRYILNVDKSISFATGSYNHSQKLVIDPIVMRWATWVSNNGTVDSHNHSIDLDAAGNIYTGGFYASAGFITVGAFQAVYGGSTDAWIAKYTEPATPGSAGSRVWQTYFGSTALDQVDVIKVGPDGFIYAGGYTYSDLATTYGSGFTTPGYGNRSGQSGTVSLGMLVKLNTSGTGAQVRTLGPTSISPIYSEFTGIDDIKILPGAGSTFSLVAIGNVLITAGFTGSGDLPQAVTAAGTSITPSPTNSGTTCGIALRLSADFSAINWIKIIGSPTDFEDVYFRASVIDAANNIYIGGNTYAASNISFNNPSTQTTLMGSSDGVLMKMNASGTVLNSRYFNSSAGAYTSIICMDMAGDYSGILVGGTTKGLAAANITAGAWQSTYGGGNFDFFAARLPLSLASTTVGTYLGGSGNESNMTGIRYDAAGMIYVAGYTASTNYVTATNPVQNVNMALLGSPNAVFTKLNAAGTAVLYSTYLGGSIDEQDPVGNSAIASYNCRIYLALTGSSNDFPLTTGAVTTNKLSSTSISEPILVSMANPPDLNSYTITPATQNITCNTTPAGLTASAPAYVIAGISRNNVAQTNGTSGAYPSGLPTITAASYQWQRSIDNGATWTNIAGATTLTLSAAQMGTVSQDTKYRLVVNGDACNRPTTAVGAVSVGGDPSASPSINCAGGNATFNANATGTGPFTYNWVLPPGSTRTNPGNVNSFNIIGLLDTDAGIYQLTVINSGGCRVTNTFSFNTNICKVSVLAFNLLSFNAAKDATGNKAILKWQSNEEYNFSHYQVERSKDGVNYEVIGIVYGRSVNGEKADYSFIDAMPQDGINYYRLLMIDKDGKGNYSPIRALNFTKGKEEITILVYPSPAKNTVTITGVNAGMQLRIISSDGKLASTYEATGTTLTIPVAKLPGGTYILQALNNNVVVATTKLIKE